MHINSCILMSTYWRIVVSVLEYNTHVHVHKNHSTAQNDLVPDKIFKITVSHEMKKRIVSYFSPGNISFILLQIFSSLRTLVDILYC